MLETIWLITTGFMSGILGTIGAGLWLGTRNR